MASRYMLANPKSGDAGAIQARLLVMALFTGCLPGATARWLRRDARDRRSPISLSLEAARDAIAHVYSLPG